MRHASRLTNRIRQIIAGSGGQGRAPQRTTATIPSRTADRSGAPGSGDFLLLLVLFVSFRLFTLFLYRPGGYVRDFSDYLYYLGSAQQIDHGALPFRDFWSEYPPPFPWIGTAIYLVTRAIPLWEDDRLWFNTAVALLMLLCETATLLALYRIARRLYDERAALRAAWIYAGLFTPVYTMTSAFDAFPLAFMMLGLWAIIAMRPTLGGLAIGTGTAIKLFPLVMMGPAWRAWSRWHQRVIVTLAALMPLILIMGAAYRMNPVYFGTFARSLVERSSWSTAWALLDGFDSIGAIVGDRSDPNADVSLHESHVPRVIVTGAFGLFYLWAWWRARRARGPEQTVRFAGFTVALFFLYFQAWNPQYLVYILPFIALLMPHLRGIAIAVMLAALNAVEHPILAAMLTDAPWLLGAVVIARTILLLLIAGELGNLALRPDMPLPRWWPRLAMAAMTAILIGGIALVPPTATAYHSSRLLKDRYGPLASILSANAAGDTLVLTGHTAFRHLYPFLGDDMALWLAAGPQKEERMEAARTMPAPFWVWIDSTKSDEEAIAIADGRPMARLSLSEGTLFRVGAEEAWLPQGIATLDGQFRLLAAHVDPPMVMPGQKFTLMLYWVRVGEPRGSYTVFTHLLTPEGALADGRDNPPVEGTQPTDRWPARTVIVDRYRLRVPWDAQAGLYPLEVGMYDPETGQRLTAELANGATANHILLPQRLRVLPALWRALRP